MKKVEKSDTSHRIKDEAGAANRSSCSPKVLQVSESGFSPINHTKLNLMEEENPYLKKSILYSLSSILRRWKKKEFILNLFNNTLLIRKKGKEKLLYLDSYAVKRLGRFKKKWCFSLDNLQNPHRKYIVGCEDQEVLDHWCKCISESTKRPNLCGSEPHIALDNENHHEDSQDIVLTTSQHYIGENLSKYDHFLSREDIMSPLKQANPSKLIYDTIPSLLLGQFKRLTQIFEKGNVKELLHENENEEWDLVFREEFIEKTFFVFMHRKSKTRGKILMHFKEKTAQEIFAELKDPEYHSLWDTSLFSVEFRHYNNGKTIRMSDIYKPMLTLNRYTVFEYLRYHGKLKDFCFIVSKSPKTVEGFEDKDPKFVFPNNQYNYAQIKTEKFKGIINENTLCLTSSKNGASLIYDVDMVFSNNQDENQKILANYLKNYRALHKLILPLCHLKNESSLISPTNGRKKMDENDKKNASSTILEHKKSNPSGDFTSNKSLLMLKKVKKFEFNKGNADNYASVEDLKVFLEYYHSGQHLIDSITNKYNLGSLPATNKFIETNEAQGHFAYKKDYARGKNGGLSYLNTELMVEQKKVILSLLKQAGSNLIHGRSIMNVSLPLEVFEPRSFLERLARSFGHAPIFLEKAGNTINVLEQMKYTIAFFLSSIVLCIQQEKPFNPIVGETFQGRINGFPIYLEQVSHHPAITYYLMKGKNYWFCGSHEAVANLGANTLVVEQKGTPFVHFSSNNTRIYFKWPMFVINGAAVGSRYLNFFSKAFVFEPNSQMLCEILFNVSEIGGFGGLFQKKESYSIDAIGGAIYKVKPGFIEKVRSAKKHHKISVDPSNDVAEVLCKVKGEWTSHVEFDGKRYWDIEREKPYLLEYEHNPLPSDCNYRDEIILMRMGNRPAAQLKKNEGENSQRYDKKLRENYQRTLKKIKKHK